MCDTSLCLTSGVWLLVLTVCEFKILKEYSVENRVHPMFSLDVQKCVLSCYGAQPLNSKHIREQKQNKLIFYLQLSLWSEVRPACRSAHERVSTGTCHLSGGQPQHRCSPIAWPD